jgi:hypothetical protein
MTKLKTTNVPDSILKASNPIQRAFDWATYELWQQETIYLDIIYGIKPELLVNPDTTKWQAPIDGHLVLDKNFDLSIKEN